MDPISNPLQPAAERRNELEARIRAAEAENERVNNLFSAAQADAQDNPNDARLQVNAAMQYAGLQKAGQLRSEAEQAYAAYWSSQPAQAQPPPATAPPEQGPTTEPVQVSATVASAPKPLQGGKRMSRKVGLGIVVLVALISVAAGVWFGNHTDNFQLQWPATWEWEDDSSSAPSTSPEASQAPISEEASPSPDFGTMSSPPPGSGTNWNCTGPAVDETDNTVTHSKDYCVDPPA